MKVLVVIELKHAWESGVQKTRLRQLLHDDIRGCLEYAASYELERLDVAGVDGVTTESILQEFRIAPEFQKQMDGLLPE